jgi:hypothetical protein
VPTAASATDRRSEDILPSGSVSAGAPVAPRLKLPLPPVAVSMLTTAKVANRRHGKHVLPSVARTPSFTAANCSQLTAQNLSPLPPALEA